MKYLKMLGLAAVAAMALMAFAGAGTASATTLCKTVPDANGNCEAAWHYPIGTVIHASQEAGTTAILEDTSGNTLVTCTESTIKGTTTTTGSSTETVKGHISAMIWGSGPTPCTATTDTIALGELEVHAELPHGNGTLTGSGSKVTVQIFGVSCVYGTGAGTDLGTVTGGNPATIDVNAVINRVEGGFLCPSTTKWTASYVITEPKPLYVATS